jgi:DNA polymerase-3 subunit epsilon
MIPKVLILDTETTGLDPKVNDIIEIGAILYSLESNTTLAAVSMVLPGQGTNEAIDINKIPVGALGEVDAMPNLRASFGNFLATMIEEADIFVAHRASFDKGFLTLQNLKLFSSKPWVCSKFDIVFDKGRPGASLVELALDHGLGVFNNHRSLRDCDLISMIFGTYTSERLRELFAKAVLPRSYYAAVTTYAQREGPKNAGFAWNGPFKLWWKRLTDLEAFAITDFQIRKIRPEDIGETA